MTTTPEDQPTVAERIDAIEQRVTALEGQLDGALTANAVLQERYGALVNQQAALVDRIAALEQA